MKCQGSNQSWPYPRQALDPNIFPVLFEIFLRFDSIQILGVLNSTFVKNSIVYFNDDFIESAHFLR